MYVIFNTILNKELFIPIYVCKLAWLNNYLKKTAITITLISGINNPNPAKEMQLMRIGLIPPRILSPIKTVSDRCEGKANNNELQN